MMITPTNSDVASFIAVNEEWVNGLPNPGLAKALLACVVTDQEAYEEIFKWVEQDAWASMYLELEDAFVAQYGMTEVR